jgi:hypothetical protein
VGVLRDHDDVSAEAAEQLEDEALVRAAGRFPQPDAQSGTHEAFLSVPRAAETLTVQDDGVADAGDEVELIGIEPMTSALPARRSPS